jgi:DNA-directed RNA polymerase delta subunit
VGPAAGNISSKKILQEIHFHAIAFFSLVEKENELHFWGAIREVQKYLNIDLQNC